MRYSEGDLRSDLRSDLAGTAGVGVALRGCAWLLGGYDRLQRTFIAVEVGDAQGFARFHRSSSA